MASLYLNMFLARGLRLIASSWFNFSKPPSSSFVVPAETIRGKEDYTVLCVCTEEFQIVEAREQGYPEYHKRRESSTNSPNIAGVTNKMPLFSPVVALFC